MARVIFWDVDTQYDFMKPDGKLYVPDAAPIIPNLERLSDYAHGHGIRVIASADDHVMEHAEISEHPDWQSTFPPHCLRGTPGQRKIPETALRDPLVIEPASCDPEALGERVRAHRGDILFHKHRFDVFTNENVMTVLEVIDPDDIVLYGVATDVCDKAAVEGLLEHRPHTRLFVVTDAVKGIDKDISEQLLKEWGEEGGRLVKTKEVVEEGLVQECVRLDVPLGRAVEPDMLRDALRRTPVDAVTVVHSETSTGVLQDVAGLAAVAREFDDVLVLVDAVTSLAGSPVEPDAWGLDFAFTGSQKALALPPGLALGVASQRMLERAKTLPDRGLYFDLVAFEEATRKFQPTNTPAGSLLYALETQLARIEREGGIEARWRRHDAMRQLVETWSEERGVAFLPREGRRSWTVSCLKLREGQSAKAVVSGLKEEGWTIGSGYGALKDSTIRIGHMGDHTVGTLEQLLALLGGLLS